MRWRNMAQEKEGEPGIGSMSSEHHVCEGEEGCHVWKEVRRNMMNPEADKVQQPTVYIESSEWR